MKVHVVYNELTVLGVYVSKERADAREKSEIAKQLAIEDHDSRSMPMNEEYEILDWEFSKK